jgi:hypothetical protein
LSWQAKPCTPSALEAHGDGIDYQDCCWRWFGNSGGQGSVCSPFALGNHRCHKRQIVVRRRKCQQRLKFLLDRPIGDRRIGIRADA